MMTCSPQLLHSFVYKSVDWGWHLLTPLGLMDLARYVCSRDLIIAEVSAKLVLSQTLLFFISLTNLIIVEVSPKLVLCHFNLIF